MTKKTVAADTKFLEELKKRRGAQDCHATERSDEQRPASSVDTAADLRLLGSSDDQAARAHPDDAETAVGQVAGCAGGAADVADAIPSGGDRRGE